MATQTVEQELVQLEKDYWQALKDQDVDAALSTEEDAEALRSSASSAVTKSSVYR